MSITIQTTDKVGWHIENYKKSIQLLIKAKAKPEYTPSRMDHASGLLLAAVAFSVFLLMRVSSAAENVFELLILPISKVKENQRNLFCYRLIKLSVLDPIHVLTATFVAVLKTVSVFCGMFSPRLALNGYILAETILLKFSEIKLLIREKLSIGFDSEPNSNTTKLKSIDPVGAITYLGQAKVTLIENDENKTEKKGDAKSDKESLLNHFDLETDRISGIGAQLKKESDRKH